MVVFLFLLSIILGFLTLLGLIIPKKILSFTANPTRSKALLFFGLPAIVFFVISMITTPTRLEIALEKPQETFKLSLSGKGMDEVPGEVSTLVNLEFLDLSNNRFTEIPEVVKGLQKLSKLDLSDNPIAEIPEWVFTETSLTALILDDTNLSELPEATNNLSVSYENTPLAEQEKQVTQKTEGSAEGSTEGSADNNVDQESHSESFTEYAMRSLLGSELGHKRKFKKGEVFYDDPVTKEEADKLGNFFVGLNYFNDENEVSVILTKNKQLAYVVQMVVIEEQIDEQSISAFGDIRKWMKGDLFPESDVEIHLIDPELNVLREITQ